VVYLLHGYTGNETTFVAEDTTYWNFFPTGTDFPENGFSGMLDDLISAGKLKEMIVVMPDASNKYGGSWYTNSEVIGNYEDYIVSDLVGYIDTHYRTIPSPDSRAIVGHSMGGYGAMKLAMKHPAVFGAVAAHGAEPLAVELRKPAIPIVLEENPDGLVGPNLEISAANQERFLTSLFYSSSAAFSPNLENPPFFVDLPFEYPSGAIIDEVWEKWLAHDPLTQRFFIKRSPRPASRMNTKLTTAGILTECLKGLRFRCRSFPMRWLLKISATSSSCPCLRG
jgi:pimeloyl-ACP methyl ester carboxylesterase